MSSEFNALRSQMIAEQLARRGIADARVLDVMRQVPRERFVPADEQREAYADRALPIDCEQTISQPYIVALMTEALHLQGHERVLEIGTGSGYQTAVLCRLAGEVISIERHVELSRSAANQLKSLHCDNCTLVVGDGTLGWPAAAPYDRIICTAAARQVPPALWEQLADGGTLVIPLGPSEAQSLVAIYKSPGHPPRPRELTGCRFVPLVGSEQPREAEER